MSKNVESGQDDAHRYRIGAVCRLTGLSQHVLRVWEKRYAVVAPERSASQRRLYSDEDVNRLSLLKTLVDRGQAIGTIADLATEELDRRVRDSAGMLRLPASTARPKLVLIGAGLEANRADCADNEVFDLVGHFSDVAAAGEHDPAVPLDVVVIERSSLHPDAAVEVVQLANRLNIRHLVLVYNYAPRAVLKRLSSERITPLRAPLDLVALEAVVASRFQVIAQTDLAQENHLPLAQTRLFNDRELAHLGAQSSAIACECPMHLAQLITSLVHFENYSAECESRSAQDAALHGYLHKASAHARRVMEQALVRVVELENLSSLPED